MEQNITFKVINFGCPVNRYESEAIISAMKKAGFIETPGPARVCIVNSCVVTGSAAAEARRVLRKAKRDNPTGITVIAGCYPQVYHRQLREELPEADIIIGTTGRSQLPGIIRDRLGEKENRPVDLVKEHGGEEIFEDMPVESSYSRIRPVVKIQEGCDEFCTYCIVALARGSPRSMKPERVLAQVGHFVEKGHREIILAGNHLGIYGRDIPGWDLAEIIRQLDKLPGNFRIRLNYIEPMDVDPSLLETIANSKRVCEHLYLPLQSGSDNILKKMGRRYGSEEFRNVVKRARKLMPQVSIYTDIIVGFPGETPPDHRATMDIVEELQLSRLHIFPYSPRPGTPAAKLKDTVRPDIKKKRVEELRALDKKLAGSFHARLVGAPLEVLLESISEFKGETTGYGLSRNNVRVRFPLRHKKVSPGEIIPVTALEAHHWGVTGEIKSMGK